MPNRKVPRQSNSHKRHSVAQPIVQRTDAEKVVPSDAAAAAATALDRGAPMTAESAVPGDPAAGVSAAPLTTSADTPPEEASKAVSAQAR